MINSLKKYVAKGYTINKRIERLPHDERSCISIDSKNIVSVCINFYKQDHEQIDIESIKDYLLTITND